jgi:hypothetical protein
MGKNYSKVQYNFKCNLIKYIVAKILHILSHTQMTLTMLQGRVSKLVTNGSKTIVMDVIGFLYVLLGSSTVQLHDSLRSRHVCTCSGAGFCSQNGDRAWGVYYRTAAFCYAFLGAERPNAKDIHKEMFPVYSGKYLSCKAVHNWVKKFSQECLKVADDAQPGRLVETATEATLQWVE